MKKNIGSVVMCLGLGWPAFADLQKVKVETPKKLAVRWMFEDVKRPKLSGLAASLAQIKSSERQKKYSRCLQQSTNLRSSLMKGWLAQMSLECATNAFEAKKIKSSQISQVINSTERQSELLVEGNHAIALRDSLVNARLSLLRWDVRKNRTRAWKAVNYLLSVREWMDKKQKTELYNLASELSFIEQKMNAAKGFALQSLEITSSSEMRDRLRTIEKAIDEKLTPFAKVSVTSDGFSGSEKYSEKELQLQKRVEDLMKKGNLTFAVSEAVEIIKKFPASHMAHWAHEQVLNSYFKVYRADAGKIFSAKKSILRKMKEVDGLRLQDWAESIFAREEFTDALNLAEEAYEKLQKTNRMKDALYIVSLSALFKGDFEKAEESLKELIKKSSGSSVGAQARFRLGVLYYRKKEFSKAVAVFEDLLSSVDASQFELSARYWLWRSFSPKQKERAEEERKKLVERYPLTYYGLRAQLEGGDKEVLLPQKSELETKQASFWWTSEQTRTWRRAQILINGGWLEEAQKELASLPSPIYDQQKAVMAVYWGHALDYRKTINLAQSIWPFTSRLVNRSYIDISYPLDFQNVIEEQASKTAASKYLIQGVIRQESAYYPKAVSSFNAKGLMQLIGGTAQQMIQQTGLKQGNLTLEEVLFDPEKNIRLGSHYLAQLLKRYDSNVVLALAAYNAGPTQLSRWLSRRDLFEKSKKEDGVSIASDLLIEEMPWSETRYYVKSVMRNAIVYKMLDQGKVTALERIW